MGELLMGVTLYAYKTATIVDEHRLDLRDGIPVFTQEFYDDPLHEARDHVVAFCYRGMEQSLDDLVAGACYAVSDPMEMVQHSYGGYNDVRDHLARGVLGVDPRTVWNDPETYAGLPMYEVINFADNEGTIGPKACERLAVDFEQQRPKFLAYIERAKSDPTRYPDAEYYIRSYEGLAAGFGHAAGTGLVFLA